MCLSILALQEMIEEADRNQDGVIDFDVSVRSFSTDFRMTVTEQEFFRVMKKRGDNPLDDLDRCLFIQPLSNILILFFQR